MKILTSILIIILCPILIYTAWSFDITKERKIIIHINKATKDAHPHKEAQLYGFLFGTNGDAIKQEWTNGRPLNYEELGFVIMEIASNTPAGSLWDTNTCTNVNCTVASNCIRYKVTQSQVKGRLTDDNIDEVMNVILNLPTNKLYLEKINW